jgi:hypothetical protein
MANTTREASKPLPVRGVYLYFKTLEAANALESFLVECDQKKLTLEVGEQLYGVGQNHFSRLVNVRAAGPDCPACPYPPHL